MKISRTPDKLSIQFGKREKRLFCQVLRLYPCIPPAHQPLSKSGKLPEPQANQRLLDEALADQRAQNKGRLQGLLADPQRFHQTETGWRLSLSPAEAEWLLQVLNDIRVGSWIMLGSPESKLEFKRLTRGMAPHFWAMELSGHFQMHLLEGLERAAT